jgi:hypothetical protein
MMDSVRCHRGMKVEKVSKSMGVAVISLPGH